MLDFALGFKLGAPMTAASHAAPIRELIVKMHVAIGIAARADERSRR
jgi:hypothetical protein